ncbi:Probable malonic semialdehyde reductase RutE [Dermatophilus congolensis]|uniref:Probable malonic semialdehyde reductase RutE n=1 Tax=Dermatophilus congolensis TaxID=1863 RepID=A0AA46BPC5_9MICO|nr:malonic semialdehyde reductase [Dermatophilus congolensis]STD12227.1 Probable malonic semialdehyde reductase RutE [Dermatophilus congolensis]
MTQTAFALDQAAQDLLFRQARTPNAFTDQPVTDEQLRQVYELAKWGPTSMNLQPLRVLAVRSPQRRAALVEHMSGGNKEKTRTAPVTLIFAADLDFHQYAAEQFPAYKDAYDMFEKLGREKRTPSAHLNATLSIAYWIVALRAAGLAVAPMTGADFPSIAKEFFPDERVFPLIVANVGYADTASYHPRNKRLAFEEVFISI